MVTVWSPYWKLFVATGFTRTQPSMVNKEPLLAQTKPLDEALITLQIRPLQVIQQLAALADQPQQALAGVVVLLVGLEVVGQVFDAGGQQRHLYLGGTGIAFRQLVVLDNLGLLGSAQGHSTTPSEQ